jgi:UDP-N-acetylglucosamine 2-epimerase (non-hydrolysing)
MKILSVVGARPQFVKAFPLSAALRREHEEVLVHTGQHYDAGLSEVFFEELSIPEPDYHLGIGSGSHGRQTGRMMAELEALCEREDPDTVLVYGDTNSTLAGAIVAAKRESALCHVEAGLRSYNRAMPEEVNRVLTDHVSDVLCVPTERACDALAAEGITRGVFVTGDVMYDAIQWARERAAGVSTVLADLGVREGEYVLATVHRAGNTDDPHRLEAILTTLSDLPTEVVLPAHPRTVKRIEEFGLEDATTGIGLTEPAGYLDFVRLLDGAERVATDSGGVQKEAFFLDTPCVTLREETEWIETVEAGWNTLVGADPGAIRRELVGEIDRPPKPSLYGDGNAAEAIVAALAGIERASSADPDTDPDGGRVETNGKRNGDRTDIGTDVPDPGNDD